MTMSRLACFCMSKGNNSYDVYVYIYIDINMYSKMVFKHCIV